MFFGGSSQASGCRELVEHPELVHLGGAAPLGRGAGHARRHHAADGHAAPDHVGLIFRRLMLIRLPLTLHVLLPLQLWINLEWLFTVA